MNKKFEEIIKEIKWEFENENHIKVLDMLNRLRKKETLLRERITNQAAIDRKLREIDVDERQILFTLNYKK